MSFTADEVQTAVESLIRGSIRRPYDTLGTRRLDVTFNDMQEAAAGVFLLHQKAPFYILSLGALRLNELVASEAEQVEALIDAVVATGNRVFPVTDISTLSNAQVALQELEGAVDARSSGFQDITKVPAFVRYKSNLDQFLLDAGSNVKLNGEVVQTPQQARANMAGLLTTLRFTHQEVIRLAKLLSSGMSDYGTVNLPALVAKGVISRARELLSSHVDELSAQTPEQRLEDLRQVVLNLLAQKAVVKQFSSFSAPSSTLFIEGTGNVYSDATHLVTPASTSLGVGGPFNIVIGRNIVDVFLDNGPVNFKIGTDVFSLSVAMSVISSTVALFTSLSAIFAASVVGDVIYIGSGPNERTRWVVTQVVSPFQVQGTGQVQPIVDAAALLRSYQAPSVALTLASSFVSELKGTANEPYDVTIGPPDTRFLVIDLDGATAVITLVSGAARTADQIAADITAQNLSLNFKAEGYFNTLKFNSLMNITQLGPTARFTVLTSNLDGLNIKVGDQVKVKSGVNAGALLTITALDVVPPATYVEATGVLTPELSVLVEVGTQRRVRIFCPDRALALSLRSTLTVVEDDSSTSTNAMLGFYPDIFSRSRPTKTSEVVTDIRNQTTLVKPSVSFQLDYAGLARTEPLFVSRCVFYKLRATGTILSALGTPNFTITVNVPSADVLTSGVVVGDYIALRTGSTPGAFYQITNVTENQIVADGTVQALLDVSIDIEVGPDLGVVLYGAIINIASGPNTGDHHVESQNAIPFELELQQAWPLPKLSSLEPIFFTDASLGTDTLAFTSTSTTTASYVKATEANALVTPGPTGVEEFMTTAWFQLPTVPDNLTVGDLLETYTVYDVPSESFEVVSVDKTLKLIELDPEMDGDPSSWAFGNIEPPFAKLRAGKVIDYNGFKVKLDTWLARSTQQSAFFVDLARFINPLISNNNPTASQVNDARAKVLQLASFLTINGATALSIDTLLSLESILTNYDVLPVPSIDVLLQSLVERGADRAKDLLLEGQFGTFFALSMDGASYVGDVIDKMRSVVQNDLPVRKAQRLGAVQSTSIAQIDSPDFEYNSDDVEQNIVPDPPVTGESIS